MNAAPTCANCDAPLTDQAVICHGCTGRLGQDLKAAPDLLAELDITITRQARIATPAKGNGDKPVPFDQRASDAATALRAVLHGWTRVLLEEGDAGDADWAVAGRSPAHWLGLNLNDIRMREWAGELVTELREACEQAEVAIDRPEHRTYIGPCGHQIPQDAGEPITCTAKLWAKPEAATVRCGTCLHEWSIDDKVTALVREGRDVWLEARAVASLAGLITRQRVTVTTVEVLVAAGRIRPQEHAVFGRPDGPDQYRLGDVLDNLKHSRDHEPATIGQLIDWLRDVHGIDLGATGKDRVRQWAARERIVRCGTDDRGRSLYDRTSVLAVASLPARSRRTTHQAA